MPITIFSDVVIPNNVLAAGVRGKQVRKNTRVVAANGTEQINVDWSRTLRQYELGFVPMTVPQWSTIEGLHEVTEGGAYGMLLSDPKDQTCPITAGVATLISGTTYQLHKRYTSIGSTRTKDRKITRPIAAGFDVKVSGVSLTVGSGYTLNTVTGVVTIPTAPSAGLITWSGNFYVPVHFINDEIDWDMVAAGTANQRLLAGPSVVLMEVRE